MNNRHLINMRNCMRMLLLILVVFVAPNVFAQSVNPSGYWKTIDDETGQPRSVVQIWLSGGQLEGKLVNVFMRPGETRNDLCVHCAPPRNTEKIWGMTMLWGMTLESQNVWSGGTILDPHNGQTYRCLITVSPDGKSMQVRGYIGISLFGRTQMWYRVSSARG
jgi:uncharacterized protein (DUF2147 family)